MGGEFLIACHQRGYPVTDKGGMPLRLHGPLRSELGWPALRTVGDRIILTHIKAGRAHLAHCLKYSLLASLQLIVTPAGDPGDLVQLKSHAPDLDDVDGGAFLRSGRSLTLPRGVTRNRNPLVDLGEHFIPQIARALEIAGRLGQISCVQVLDLRQRGQRCGRRQLVHRRCLESLQLSYRFAFAFGVAVSGRLEFGGCQLYAKCAPDVGRSYLAQCGGYRRCAREP